MRRQKRNTPMTMPAICPTVKSVSEVKETYNPISDYCSINELCVCMCVSVCVCVFACVRAYVCMCVLTAGDGSHIAVITITLCNRICKSAVEDLHTVLSGNTSAGQVRDDGGLITAIGRWINTAAGWKNLRDYYTVKKHMNALITTMACQSKVI